MYKVRTALAVAAAGALASHAPVSAYQSTLVTAYDDTHQSLSNTSEIITLTKSYGYSQYKLSSSADGNREAIDARQATFKVANSENSSPTSSKTCESGSNSTNPYPFYVYKGDKVAVVGGLMLSEVPQSSDWQYTYCNSAAVMFKYAPGGTVDGMRMTGAWDGIRLSDSSSDFTVKNMWASGVRDDFVENDRYYAGSITDSLVDGAFQFLSMQGDSSSSSTSRVVKLNGNVIRLKDMLYKGNMKFGALLKGSSYSPQLSVNNTVLAIDTQSGSTLSSNNWSHTWKKMTSCSNNLLLWMSDKPIPSSMGTIKSCFTVLKGSTARAKWAEVKKNWINCHPKLRRDSIDPASYANECQVNTFGGYNS